MRCTMLDEQPPADANQYGRLRYVFTAEQNGRFGVCLWRGRSLRPERYVFRSEQAMDHWIEERKRAEDEHVRYEAKRKVEREARLTETLAQIQVGTILHYSWGYDQTQCEYYQVVERRGRRVVIREIACETVPGSEGFMCCQERPILDRFVGEPITKIIGPWGISMEFGTATPCGDASSHYHSWYA